MRMPTTYQMGKIKFYIATALILLVSFIISANLYNYYSCEKISLADDSYILKNGLPIFTSEERYIEFIKNYPYPMGTNFRIHRVNSGETIWKVSKQYGISIKTIIATNPHLKDFQLQSAKHLVIPSSNGAPVVFKNLDDFKKIATNPNIQPQAKLLRPYRYSLLSLVKPHDMAMVFINGIEPPVVNDKISKLYTYMNYFSHPVKSGFYTSMFGDRVDPFGRGKEFHNGIDIADRIKTKIMATRDGIVFFSGWKGGFGNTIIIQHTDGYTSLYGHCSKLLVKKGEWVKQNQVIALMGSTGRSTGSHLHFTVFRHGKAVNPINFLW